MSKINKKEKKEVHYKGRGCYVLKIKSKVLPFVEKIENYKDVEDVNNKVQKFVSFIEKKFDTIWYIGADYFDNDLIERFMFHNGGFMEISLDGILKVYLYEDKIDKFKKALRYAVEKMSNKGSAAHIVRHLKVGKKLISLEASLTKR